MGFNKNRAGSTSRAFLLKFNWVLKGFGYEESGAQGQGTYIWLLIRFQLASQRNATDSACSSFAMCATKAFIRTAWACPFLLRAAIYATAVAVSRTLTASSAVLHCPQITSSRSPAARTTKRVAQSASSSTSVNLRQRALSVGRRWTRSCT